MDLAPDNELGRFDDVADRVPVFRPVLEAVRTLIASEAPGAVEKASKREGSVWWGLGPRKTIDGFAWAMPHKAHVNFGFMRGAHLPDPTGRLEGTGANMRHIKLRETSDVDAPDIASLLRSAVAERCAALRKD